MSEQYGDVSGLRLAGYSELIHRYNLMAIPNWHRSQVSNTGRHTTNTTAESVEEVFPAKYWPGEGLGDHLEFAFKYDGVNLGILAVLFDAIEDEEILEYIASKPTGKYARRIWYLFELITSRKLPLDDLTQGNYVDVLDKDRYHTFEPAKKIQRQRVNDNLLGNRLFCPTIRKTEKLDQFVNANFQERVREIISAYPIQQLKRASSYLYTKETKSSFEIEKVKPSSNRTEKFIALLQLAETEDFCNKPRLINLQNRVVDPRFQDSDYRSSQNYIGQTIPIGHEIIHYVCPKPEDIANLMDGLIATHEKLDGGKVDPVLQAAVIAYGFVFLHPFEDGNGRIHRFLIHNILARRDFTPQGIMFPVSAAMLSNFNEYDQSLEIFSKHIMTLVDYTRDDDGIMTVQNETRRWYQFVDLTAQAEALYWFIEKIVDTELVSELEFLSNYDKAWKATQEIVDMPDRKIDLFIQLCVQNRGKLSERKRDSHFDFLSEEEAHAMEQAIQEIFFPDVM